MDSRWFWLLMLVESVLLVVLQFNPGGWISKFYARRACHGLTGFLLLALDPRMFGNRVFVYTVVGGSLAMLWLPVIPNWRFGAKRDIGMTFYLMLVATWFYLQLPVVILAPVLFADPSGAIVGRLANIYLGESRNPKWSRDKTVFGSSAVFLVSTLTIAVPADIGRKVAVAALIALVEGLSGAWDNITITIVVVGAYVAFGTTRNPSVEADL